MSEHAAWALMSFGSFAVLIIRNIQQGHGVSKNAPHKGFWGTALYMRI